jgi:hypothetical protein
LIDTFVRLNPSGTKWTNFDPLTMSDTSTRIYEQFEALFSKKEEYENRYQNAIQRHYGKRPFKCGFLNCSFRRYGFETRSLRKSHIKYHDRPWKCGFPDCEFQGGGFLSRKMRDEHLDRFHQEAGAVAIAATEKPDADEIQPLLFDLVKSDSVDIVKNLLEQLDGLPHSCQTELRMYAARFGSPSMLDLIAPFDPQMFNHELIKCSIKYKNLEAFRHLLSQRKGAVKNGVWSRTYAYIGAEVLQSDSEEIFEEWSKYVRFEFETWKPIKKVASLYASTTIITATAGQPYKEQLLSMLWRKHVMKSLDAKCMGRALTSVASSSCSVELAKLLIDHGAMVDHKWSASSSTPLQCAARRTTAAAAELMKFLLSCGADPEARPASASARHKILEIREEKGAKGISKWLGVSWDELVAQTKEEREKAKAEESKSEEITQSVSIGE